MKDVLEQAQVVSFDDTKKAFSGKDDKQLNKTSWLFKLMGNPRLVSLGSKLTLFAIKIGLPIGPAIKATIFKQFCGGENLDESKKVVEQLQKSKIGSILDYSVEGEESEEDFTKTKDEIIRIIQIAKNNPAIPYTCLKVTGIAPFALLEKVNSGATLTEVEKRRIHKS